MLVTIGTIYEIVPFLVTIILIFSQFVFFSGPAAKRPAIGVIRQAGNARQLVSITPSIGEALQHPLSHGF